eukprot:3897795-Karenia_brevis.AAC.1
MASNASQAIVPAEDGATSPTSKVLSFDSSPLRSMNLPRVDATTGIRQGVAGSPSSALVCPPCGGGSSSGGMEENETYDDPTCPSH